MFQSEGGSLAQSISSFAPALNLHSGSQLVVATSRLKFVGEKERKTFGSRVSLHLLAVSALSFDLFSWLITFVLNNQSDYSGFSFTTRN